MAVLARSFSEEKFYSSPSLHLLWAALNPLPFSRAVPALLSSITVPNLRSSSYDSCPAASTLAFSPSGKALGACRAGRMTSPVPDTAENTEGRRDPKYSCSHCLQIPPQHLSGTHTTPCQWPGNFPCPQPLAGSPHPFPPYLPALAMAADMGSSVQTRAPYELFLALWLKILRKAVLSGRRRSRKRRAEQSISDPRTGEEPHGSLNQWGQLLAPPQAYADGHCRSSMEEEGV